MAKLDLPRIDPLKGSASQINAAFDEIEQFSDNQLSRTGTDPNQMESVLDMNGNKIINGVYAEAGSDIPTWEQVLGLAFGEGAPIDVGESNVGRNIGTGIGVYAGKNNITLNFKSLQAGSGATITESGGTITISAVGTGGDGDVSKITIFSVADYGAVGDGVADDSGAIQATLDAAQNSADIGDCIGTVYFPPGQYRCDTLGNLTGRIMMFAHPNSVELIGNISSNQTYPISADTLNWLDCTAPFISIFGINFKTENSSFALTIKHDETGASEGAYVQVGSISNCHFYGSRGLRCDSLIQFAVQECTFFTSAVGLDLRTVTNTPVNRCTFNNCAEAGVVLQLDPNRSSLRNNYPGGENVRLVNCDFGVCTVGIYAYKTGWTRIDNCMIDNCALPLYAQGCAELTGVQTYFGAAGNILDTMSGHPDFTPPPNAGAATEGCVAWIIGDQDLSTGPVPASGMFNQCQFVSYNNFTSNGGNQSCPLVEIEGGAAEDPNQGNYRAPGQGVSFIACLLLIGSRHVITPALLHVDGINGLKIIANRFSSVNLTTPAHTTTPGFAPYKWETQAPETGVNEALAHSNDFWNMRDDNNDVIGTAQETTFGDQAPDLSNYYNKQESDARYELKARKIVVIGDSLTTFPEFNKCWPYFMGRHMVNCGISVEVHTISQNGFRWADARTQAIFDGQTAVNRTISLAPDLVIVSLGYNDGFVDGVDATATAQLVFEELRAGLPNATIMYASQRAFDATRYSAANTRAFAVLPYLQPRETNGGNMVDSITFPAESYSEIGVRTNVLMSAFPSSQGRLISWETMDNAIKSNIATWVNGQSGNDADYFFTLDIFKAFRLGLGNDVLHLKETGQEYVSGYSYQFLKNNAQIQAELPWLSPLVPLNSLGTDPESLFAEMFAPPADSTTDYTTRLVLNSNGFIYWADARQHDYAVGLHAWFRPNKMTWTIDSSNFELDVGLGRDTFMMFSRQVVGLRYVYGKVWKASGSEPSTWTPINLNNNQYPIDESMVYCVTGTQFASIFNITASQTLETYYMKIKVTSDSSIDTGDIFGQYTLQIKSTPFPTGAGSFIALDDTPNSYNNQGGKVVYVANAEDGLEFRDEPVSGGSGDIIFYDREAVSTSPQSAGEQQGVDVTSWNTIFTWSTNIVSGVRKVKFELCLAYSLLSYSEQLLGSGGPHLWWGGGVDVQLRRGSIVLKEWQDIMAVLPNANFSRIPPLDASAVDMDTYASGGLLNIHWIEAGIPGGNQSFNVRFRATALRFSGSGNIGGYAYQDTRGFSVTMQPNGNESWANVMTIRSA